MDYDMIERYENKLDNRKKIKKIQSQKDIINNHKRLKKYGINCKELVNGELETQITQNNKIMINDEEDQEYFYDYYSD